MDVVLGVDIGTTAAKAVAFDRDGAVRGSAEVAYPLDEPHPGWAEQDAALVADAAITAMARAAAAASDAGARIAGAAFSSAMHGLVGLDDGGRPLTPLMTWADTRAVAQAEALRRSHPHLHARTGTPLHPMSPLVKLAWLREHEPQLLRDTPRWAGIKELVLHRLTGEWAVDHSIASATGLLALDTLDWDPEAIEAAGVRREQLSPLVPAAERFCLTADGAVATGLDTGTPLVIGAGDGPLANLGVGAVRPGVAACSIGTSGALRLMVERPAIDPAGRVFCYALTPGRWVVGGAINNGGSVLRWAGDALAPDLGEHPEEALLALAAGVAPGSDGLLMLPYLLSERAPHWNALQRGAYVGLTRAHGRGHLVRAAVEGVCQQLALVLASLREAGQEVREVRATGGFARSAFWRQLLTDVLGMPVAFPAGDQGSAFGAALLGMQALGLDGGLDRAADLIGPGEQLEPDAANAALYARLRPLFASLSDALAPAFRTLRE